MLAHNMNGITLFLGVVGDLQRLWTMADQSCFLPSTNIQFAWDSTSLGMFKTCPRLYYYTMILGFTGKGESIHLRWGQEYHAALQDYDLARAAGADHQEGVRAAVRGMQERTLGWEPEIDDAVRSQKLKTKDELFRTVIAYLDHFDPDPAATVIMGGGEPAVELSFKFEVGWGPQGAQEDEAICRAREQGNLGDVSHIAQPYLLCGHLDRVVTFQDQLFVMDRKTTTTTLSQHYFAQYDMSNQMTLYTLAGKVVLDAPIRGVIIDAVQLMVEGPRFVRGMTYRTEDQLYEWLDDLKVHLRIAEEYAVADHWPMNDTACDKFGGCRFRGICSKSPAVRERFLRSDFVQLEPEERWNPLKNRTVMT